MAFAIIWSKQALDDLRGIVAFIARHNPDVAAQFGYRLISKVDLLSEFPAMGRVVPEQNSTDVRELILRPYRIILKCAIKKTPSLLCAFGMERVENPSFIKVKHNEWL